MGVEPANRGGEVLPSTFVVFFILSHTERERQSEKEYQRATVTTVIDKESDRESKSGRESDRGGGVRKRSENRDRDRQRNRERHAETETESFTTVFYGDCTVVYPGLLLAIPAIEQATSNFVVDRNREHPTRIDSIASNPAVYS